MCVTLTENPLALESFQSQCVISQNFLHPQRENAQQEGSCHQSKNELQKNPSVGPLHNICGVASKIYLSFLMLLRFEE